jgi:hypothetical protein
MGEGDDEMEESISPIEARFQKRAGQNIKIAFKGKARNSNLSPLSLSRGSDLYTSQFESDGNEPGGVKVEDERSGDNGQMPKSFSARGTRRQGWGDSAVELVDRSRPW